MEVSRLQRDLSEEVFVRSCMEGNAVAPATDAMSFLTPPEPARIDSEELFTNWLTNLDTSSFPPLWEDHQTPELSRRMSNEFAALYGKHTPPQSPYSHGDTLCAKDSDTNVRESHSGNLRNQAPSTNFPVQDPVSWQMIDLFQQPRPMTRSRSSELRRKYLAMQDHTSPAIIDSLHWFATHGSEKLKQSLGAFTRALASKRPNSHSSTFSQSPSSPSSPQLSQKNGGTVSGVVNMLKGTIERKKLAVTQRQLDTAFSPTYVGELVQPKEFPHNWTQNLHQRVFPKEEPQLQQEFVACSQITKDRIHAGIVTPHTSCPSDLSDIAHGLSTGAATTEEPCNSNHTVSTHANPMKCSGENNWSLDETFQQNNVPSPISDGTSNGEEDILNSDNKKRQSSLTASCRSGFNADAEDLTKKRRIERKRMMTETKGRSYVPPMPTDLQAAVHRCDALEKDVRSLKLNLSFMNRKDSEQTKRIEDLEKQNEGLLAENIRLLEDLKHVTSGKNFNGGV